MALSPPDLAAESLDYPSLFERLSGGLTLVTGNTRLARVLRGRYSQWRIGRGDTQWRSPAILSWDAWLGGLWESASLLGIEGSDCALAGRRQLLTLWETVLRDDPGAAHLLSPGSLAARLSDARRLLVEWRLDPEHPTWFADGNENAIAFRRWNRAFEALCRRKFWIAPEDRTALLCRAVRDSIEPKRDSSMALPARLGLLGFDEFNPGQIELLAALMQAGVSLTRMTITPAQSAASLWQGLNSKDELQRMARWVRYWFEKEPGSRIAVVVPDLQARRREVEYHLREILTPGAYGAENSTLPWNTSLGEQLARVPMIESAFDVLRLLDSRIDIQDISRVLRSPWISGGMSERNSRALLEKRLREKYPRQLSLSEVRFRAGEIRKFNRDREKLPPDQRRPRAWNSPVMASLLDTLIQFERDSRGKRQAAAWAEAFGQLLSSLGWPMVSEADAGVGAGERSRNWQSYQAWQDALRELATLDATLPRMGRKAATDRLRQVCRDRVFQPQGADAAIQVLGLYEISGLRFDHMWVLGLHGDNWPPAARPDPFIPGQLQKLAQIPHSSPKRELEVARSVTRRLLATADDCVFSFPGQLEGEAILPSPLFLGERFKPVDELPAWGGDSWQSRIYRAEKPVSDPLRPPGPLRGKTARGGSSILRHQALCPFRAFASNRLGAESLETPVDGISPMLHGSLVHRVMECFWEETRSRDALLSLDRDALEARIRKHVDRVVKQERSLDDRPEVRKIESDRLARLASSCLELEKNRGPFEVAAFEQRVLQEFHGQEIRLVIDRIDTLPSGDHVIIDYKTGRVDPKKWFGDRPEDPQLPLYSISTPATPAAIVFSVIRHDECLYRGVTASEGICPGLPPGKGRQNEKIIEAGRNMPETIENWRQTLHRLMAEFLAGEAAIDPKHGRRTCDNSYCDLQPLCRISELEQVQKLESGEGPA